MPSTSRNTDSMSELLKMSSQALHDGIQLKNQIDFLLKEGRKSIDLRSGAIQYQLVYLHNLSVSFILIRDNLLHYQWWDDHFPGIPGSNEKMENASRFSELIMYGTLIGSFSYLESFIRNIVFAIDGEHTVKRHEHFYKIRKTLFNKLISIDFPELNEYFQLMQVLRNCIHNSGVYYDPKSSRMEIYYSGIRYVFLNGVPPNCVQPEFLIERISDAINIIFKISSNQSVIEVGKIEDRYDLLGSHETAEMP